MSLEETHPQTTRMGRLRRILRVILQILGLISVVTVVAFFAIKLIVGVKDRSDLRTISLEDGPHLFWLSDSAVRSITFVSGTGENIVRTVESTLDLRDREGTLRSIAQSLKVDFNPYEPYPAELAEYRADIIAAVSDIHGSYRHFVGLLKNNGVIDENLAWKWSSGHLVVVGDVCDKGPDATKCLWLIKKLEKQAVKAGGKVHFLLGNHEMMLLRDEDDITMRGLKYRTLAAKTGVAYNVLLGKDTELGRWLRTKNSVVRINDRMFVHGGISEEVFRRKLTIDSLNILGRRLASMKHLLSVGTMERSVYELLNGNLGPYSYRGYVGLGGYIGGSNIRSATLDSILSFYGCRQMIVGHAPVSSIKSLYSGRVMAIDIKLPTDDVLGDSPEGEMLLIEKGDIFRLKYNGSRD